MIVTLPVTFFFFLNNSYNPGKTKLSGRGLGGNFKSLRFNFEEGPCRQEEKNFPMAKWLDYKILLPIQYNMQVKSSRMGI